MTRVRPPMPPPPPGRRREAALVDPSRTRSAHITDALLGLLRAHRVRASSQRTAVIRALVSQRESHPTAEQIFLEARRRGEGIGIATVYNTLELLRQLGAVSELGFSSGPTRFDLNLTPHANLVCTSCGRISDHPLGPLTDWVSELGQRADFEVRRQRLDLYGLCSRCRAAPERPGRRTGLRRPLVAAAGSGRR